MSAIFAGDVPRGITATNLRDSSAAKYASDKDAIARLAKKVREGGVGVWGQIPMPANPQVSDADAITLATWVLSAR